MPNTTNYQEQGGKRWAIGSGGELDIESGGALKIAGTAVTSAAADLNQGAGAAAASLLPCYIPTGTQQALSGAGAVNLTAYNTAVTNTGSDALTLADATIAGHRKRVQMIVDPGTDSTLTFNTNATIVFADVGDTAELVWSGSAWVPVALYNIVDGATAPAYTPAS